MGPQAECLPVDKLVGSRPLEGPAPGPPVSSFILFPPPRGSALLCVQPPESMSGSRISGVSCDSIKTRKDSAFLLKYTLAAFLCLLVLSRLSISNFHYDFFLDP